MTKTNLLIENLTENERRAFNAAYLLEPPGAEVVHQFARALANERAEVERLRNDNANQAAEIERLMDERDTYRAALARPRPDDGQTYFVQEDGSYPPPTEPGWYQMRSDANAETEVVYVKGRFFQRAGDTFKYSIEEDPDCMIWGPRVEEWQP